MVLPFGVILILPFRPFFREKIRLREFEFALAHLYTSIAFAK